MPPLTIHTEMRIVLEGVAPWSSADKRRIEGQTTVRDRCNGGCDQKLELLSAGGMPFKALPEYYAMEKRSHRFVLAFAGSCVLASAYEFLQGAWPFGLVEGYDPASPSGIGGWNENSA